MNKKYFIPPKVDFGEMFKPLLPELLIIHPRFEPGGDEHEHRCYKCNRVFYTKGVKLLYCFASKDLNPFVKDVVGATQR